MLVQLPKKPRRIRQTPTHLADQSAVANKLLQFLGGRRAPFDPQPLKLIPKNLAGATDHVFVGPRFDQVWQVSDHKVVMVGHEREEKDIDGKVSSKVFCLFPDPSPSVRKIYAKVPIQTKQEGPSNTTRIHVIGGVDGRVNGVAAGSGWHGLSPTRFLYFTTP
jgi:hypothetical protein